LGSYFTAAQLTNSAFSGDDADPDHDHFPNLKEYVAGTDPTNGNSCLPMSVLAPIPMNAGQFVVNWRSETSKLYTLHAGTNLVTGFTLTLGSTYETRCRHGIRIRFV